MYYSSRPYQYNPNELVVCTSRALIGLKEGNEKTGEYVDAIEAFANNYVPDNHRDDSRTAIESELISKLSYSLLIQRHRQFDIHQKMVDQSFRVYKLIEAITHRTGLVQLDRQKTTSVYSKFAFETTQQCHEVEEFHRLYCDLTGYNRPMKRRKIDITDYEDVKQPTDLIPFLNLHRAKWDHLVIESRDIALAGVLSKIGFIGTSLKCGFCPHPADIHIADDFNGDYHAKMASEFSKILSEHNELAVMGKNLTYFGIKAFPAHHACFREPNYAINPRVNIPRP